MTLPEIILWQWMRRRPEGLRFRHQHPLGPFSLDFYCPSAKLAIEVDGEVHNRGDQPERDARRGAWVAGQGIRTLRIAAADVLSDLDAVTRLIVAECGIFPSTSLRLVPLPMLRIGRIEWAGRSSSIPR